MRLKIRKNNKGIALILTVGVLAMMLIIGTSFTINMMADYKSTGNMMMEAQARAAAEAGLNLAIVSARTAAIAGFNSVPATTLSGSLGSVGRGNTAAYSVKITDTAGQINVNDTNPNLGAILENLVAVLGSPLQAGDGNLIVSYRDGASVPGHVYMSKQEVIDAFPGAMSAKTAKFNRIADYITVNSYIDPNSESTTQMPLTGLNSPASVYQPKAPININSASAEVLQAVLTGISDGITTISSTKAAAWGGSLASTRGFTGWSQLDVSINVINSHMGPAAVLSAQEISVIENNANPNKIKPSTYTTDFCFQPSGIYEITSTGTAGPAQKQITAIVQVYKILNYTTKEQFRADTYAGGPSLPVYSRVTWLNSCPVEMRNADPAGTIAANYKTIPNSLKLGYWDNFDEDNDSSNPVGYSWTSFAQETPLYPMNVSPNGSGNNKLWGSLYPKFTLDPARWAFSNNFSLRVYLKPNPMGDGNECTGNVEFHSSSLISKAKLWIQHWGFYYGSGRTDITKPPLFWRPTIDIDPDGACDSGGGGPGGTHPKEGQDFFDSRVFLELLDPPQNERIYHMGDLYGLIDPINDHYDWPPTHPSHYYDWATEQNNDQYHGIFPDYQTFKMVVNSTPSGPTPNYRVWLALGTATHNYYNYNNGWYLGWYGCSPPTTGYILVPFHSDSANSSMGDRYNYWRYVNSQPNSWQTTYWYLVLYGNNSQPTWDDLRIIPDSGYYQSPAFSPGGTVRWGTVSWTLTIPDTASAASELCSVQVNTGSGLNNMAINGPIGGVSNSEVFRINLSSSDAEYRETPVLEDITITYLPKAQVLYLRES